MQANHLDLESIADIVNIGAGRAGWKLSDALGTGIDICVSRVAVEAPAQAPGQMTVSKSFVGRAHGSAAVIMSSSAARAMTAVLGSYGSYAEIPEIAVSQILTESGGVLIHGVVGALCGSSQELSWQPAIFQTSEPFDSHCGPADTGLVAHVDISIESRLVSAQLAIVINRAELKRFELEESEVAYATCGEDPELSQPGVDGPHGFGAHTDRFPAMSPSAADHC